MLTFFLSGDSMTMNAYQKNVNIYLTFSFVPIYDHIDYCTDCHTQWCWSLPWFSMQWVWMGLWQNVWFLTARVWCYMVITTLCSYMLEFKKNLNQTVSQIRNQYNLRLFRCECVREAGNATSLYTAHLFLWCYCGKKMTIKHSHDSKNRAFWWSSTPDWNIPAKKSVCWMEQTLRIVMVCSRN